MTKEEEFHVLWAKYEDIAMHFNDLLMRLRSQSLAGIAAVSTLVGIFTKTSVLDAPMDWAASTALFVAMAVFWIAIFCLDFFYYNRLLLGAVSAITELEALYFAEPAAPLRIHMSTMIEREFALPAFTVRTTHFWGVLTFYGLVLAVIIAGIFFSIHMYLHSY